MIMNAAYPRRDFAETLLMCPAEPALATPYDGRAAGIDPLEQMAMADRADRGLLLLVAGAAVATLALSAVMALL
jgi:hypothetical protein